MTPEQYAALKAAGQMTDAEAARFALEASARFRLVETLQAERDAAQRDGYHMGRPTPMNPLGVEKRAPFTRTRPSGFVQKYEFVREATA